MARSSYSAFCIAAAAERGRERWAKAKAGHVPAEPRPRLISVHFIHFLSGVWSETHTSACCCCLTCHVFAARTEQHCAEIPLFPHCTGFGLHQQSFPALGHWGSFGVGQQVWFGSLPSPPQQILPLFFAQRLQRQFAPSRKLESLMPACNYKG